MEGAEGIGHSPLPCPAGCELESLGMAAPTSSLHGLARSGVRMGSPVGRGAREFGGRGWVTGTPQTVQTRCCPRNLQSSPLPGHPFPTASPAGPPILHPTSSPWLAAASREREPRCSAGQPQTCLAALRSPRSACSRAARPRCSPSLTAAPGPRPPPPGCGAPRPGSREGKLPGPAPRGAFALAASAGRRREPAVGLPHGILRREWGRQISGCPSFEQPRGWRRERSRPLRHTGPLRASGRPLRAELSWEFARGRLCTPRALPEDAEPSAGAARWPPECRARWRGRERRGQCLLLLTKGSSSRRRGRPCCTRPPVPATAELSVRAASPRPWPPAAGLARGAGSREPGREAAGGCGGRGEVLEGMLQGSAPAKPLLAASELQDPRATSGGGQRELSPHLQSLGRGGRSAGAAVPLRAPLPGRRCARAVPFVYTLEDTQLRKHRRSPAEWNGDPRGASFGFGGCRAACVLPSTGLQGSSVGEHIGDVSGWESGKQLQVPSRGFFPPCHGLSLRMLFMYFFSPRECLIYELRDNWVQPMPVWLLQLHFG